MDKFDRVPRDGQHFTPEELMEEKLKEATNPPKGRDVRVGSPYQTYGQAVNQIDYGNLNVEMYDPFDGRSKTVNIRVTNGQLQGHTTINDMRIPAYEVDADLIEDIDDMRAIIKAIDRKFRTFYSRDEVRGIEHLVRKIR